MGPSGDHSSIQSAVDSAAPGDIIQIQPGVYAENVVLNKGPLMLRGARSGVDARGRVSGVPSPAIESIIAPVSGPAIQIAAGASGITLDGLSLSASPAAASGVISLEGGAPESLAVSNNDIRVAGGASGSAIWLNSTSWNATISRNRLVGSSATSRVIFLDGTDSFDGLHLLENELAGSGTASGTGLFVDGAGSVGPSPARTARISGNRFTNFDLGVNAGSMSLEDVEISGNTFEANNGGMAAGPFDCSITGNLWKNNSSYGLRLTGFGGASDADRGARASIVEENVFEGNGASLAPSGHGDLVLDDQAPGTQGGNIIRRNKFLSSVGIFSNESGETVTAALNYWNAVDGPGGTASGGGGELSGTGSVTYKPWFADADLTTLDYGDAPLSGSVNLAGGQSISGVELTLAPGAVLTVGAGAKVDIGDLDLQGDASIQVNGGAVNAGQLAMAPGASINVVNGDLSLDPLGVGEYHTISGSFAFYNCLGSLDINANTTFSGSTLALVTDIHLAAGVTLVVTGSLQLDGCVLDSPGVFNILVNFGATFEMVRCDVTNAFMTLVGSDLDIHDCVFTGSSLTAFSTVNGGSIYHNVFNGGTGALNILPGAVVTTVVEGWGNVASEAAVQNHLQLGFGPPADPTRTLDSAGNLYVQPGDAVEVALGAGNLVDKAQAVEALLGYSTDYLSYDSLLPSADWLNFLAASADDSGVVGKLNTAVGLSFSHPDPDGTLLDGKIADVRMTANTLEGLSKVFFRAKTEEDSPLVDTRITASSGGNAYYRNAPFTANSAELIVDGSDPEFATGATVTQIQSAVPVDLLQDGSFTRSGLVTVTFDSRDELAGVEDSDVAVEFVGLSTGYQGSFASASPVSVSGVDYTRYVFELTVDSSTSDGIYNVNALVMDRSGNLATLPIGSIEISKFRVNVTVAPQGLVSTAITRDVVFVATSSSGASLATWTLPLNFTGGVGSVLIEGVPTGTVNISAKMAWNLRRRIPVTFDSEGMAGVAFAGSASLIGGDLNGNNVINSGDFNVLSGTFGTSNPLGDITGNGVVNSGDFNILSANWLTLGDPP